ncbi:MAG: glycoside hydrolase family 5 protein, partial [Fidelibacterota bacterium]
MHHSSFSMLTFREKKIHIILLLIMTLLISSACPEEEPDKKDDRYYHGDPFARNQLLKRSINLGNALEAPHEGDWGVILQKHFFDSISAEGFTAVRVPIRWSAHALENPPFTIDPQFLNRVDWVLAQAQQRGLATVINMHHYEELFREPENHWMRFLEIWKQLTVHYQLADTTLFFEVLNEPHDRLTPELWNQLLAEVIDSIRMIDPVHTLIIGTAEWGGIAAINKLEIPSTEDNVIFTFHYYEPFQFTHQGAEWT